MDKSDKLKEIILYIQNQEKLYQWGHPFEEDYPIKARQQILTWIKEEIMPKEKQGIKFHSGRQNSEMSAYSPTDNQKVGYNRCIADILKRLEE
jgi:hypothetical protein